MGESPQQEAAHRRVDHGFAGLAQALIHLAEPPALTEQAERALVYPSPREHAPEPLLGGWKSEPFEVAHHRVLGFGDKAPPAPWLRRMLHDRYRPAQLLFNPVFAASRVSLICPQLF